MLCRLPVAVSYHVMDYCLWCIAVCSILMQLQGAELILIVGLFIPSVKYSIDNNHGFACKGKYKMLNQQVNSSYMLRIQ